MWNMFPVVDVGDCLIRDFTFVGMRVSDSEFVPHPPCVSCLYFIFTETPDSQAQRRGGNENTQMSFLGLLKIVVAD